MSRTFASYVVSGAGRTYANGTYAEHSTDYFVFGQCELYKNYAGKWQILDYYSGSELYITTDTPATPDLGTWVKGQSGLEPPPTVVASTPIPANPDILVSGAGSDLVNGTYEHTAFGNGKPIYTKGSERYKIVNYDAWMIFAPFTHPEYGDVDAPYYQEKQSGSGSPATPDLVAEWEIWTMEGEPTAGVTPPPTVTEYTPDPPHDIAVDPLTAQVNITQPTLEQTHKLSATALGATAGISEPTLSVAQYIRTPTPDCRRLTIHAEDRTLTIPREDRTLRIKCCD